MDQNHVKLSQTIHFENTNMIQLKFYSDKRKTELSAKKVIQQKYKSI